MGRDKMHRVAGFGAVTTAIALGQVNDHDPLLVGRSERARGQHAGEKLLGGRSQGCPAGDKPSGSTNQKVYES
ncbi:MAG: hypothetical protein A3J28_11375 [Acidobacteria bacterium RIFCSPLOWO2_12_FULL_60_22]|nr:MAG: hypothetical protein A3J28_11375 [Acidobacteria bacterium RIFCSPLOWO2_12_FULL_60_22]